MSWASGACAGGTGAWGGGDRTRGRSGKQREEVGGVRTFGTSRALKTRPPMTVTRTRAREFVTMVYIILGPGGMLSMAADFGRGEEGRRVSQALWRAVTSVEPGLPKFVNCASALTHHLLNRVSLVLLDDRGLQDHARGTPDELGRILSLFHPLERDIGAENPQEAKARTSSYISSSSSSGGGGGGGARCCFPAAGRGAPCGAPCLFAGRGGGGGSSSFPSYSSAGA